MKKLILAGMFGLLAGLSAIWIFPRASGHDPQPPLARTVSAAPAGQPAETARGTVTLAPAVAKRMGLAATVLMPVRHAADLRTTAVLLSPQGLARQAAAYVSATEALAVARADLTVARNEYERQNTLYRADQTTSLKALQAARGALATSQAQADAARRQANLDALKVGQQWGPVLQEWLVARSQAFERILGEQQWLVQVTLDARAARLRPETARLVAPSGVAVTARFLSSFPQTNPVIQGLNFLYVIPARPGFAPGLNLVAEIPVGPARRGVVVPAGAVVWSDGEAWAYKQIAPNHFQRFVVSTGTPVSGGWFVTRGFAPGDRVVTRATEELFSAETQPAGGEGDND